VGPVIITIYLIIILWDNIAMKRKINQIDLFLDSIREIYKEKSTEILQNLKIDHPTTFRINTLVKQNITETLTEIETHGFVVTKGPIDNSYIATVIDSKEKIHISDTNAFINGKIYVQELSSMLPPMILDPKQGEKILDISAAPGSKTTQLAALSNNGSKILAIEKHPMRLKTLEHNIKLQQTQNVHVLQANGIKFDMRNAQFKEYFDKVLVDAPCSSEGQFNLTNPKTYKYWNIHKRDAMSKIQKGLLIAGFRMLKTGGTLVYSTCTYAVEENEMVLDWLLSKVGDQAKITKIELPIANTLPGKAYYKTKKLNDKVKNSSRILPNKHFTGFFVAKIQKVL